MAAIHGKMYVCSTFNIIVNPRRPYYWPSQKSQIMARRFRYTPPAKFSQCPSFVATFIRVETEGAMKGWTTFRKDGDDDHLYSMYFTPEDNIEWLDDNDTQASAKADPSDATSASDNSSAVVAEPNQQPSRKPRKRKRKSISDETEQQEPEPADKNKTQSNGLFDLLFMVAVLLLVVGVVALGPGMLGFAAMFGTGGALARAE